MQRPLRLGVIASEFFDARLSGIGGFGWAARMLADTFRKNPSLGVEMTFLASEIRATRERTEEHAHGTRVLLRRESRVRNLAMMQRERFDLLLTVDYEHPYTVYLRSAPRTPVIFWVRDPRTPADVRKIHTLRIPGAEGSESEAHAPQGIACSDGSSMAEIVRESAWLHRKLLFATPAPHLVSKLPEAYGHEPWNMQFLPNIIPVPTGKVEKSERPSVVFLGRLDPIKRPWIFAALAQRHAGVDFYFMGKPHFTGPGSWQAVELPNLHYMGHVGEQEKQRLLCGAWAAVNTSIHEGLAISLLEALAWETPLLACQNPGFTVSRHGVYAGRFEGSGMDGLDAFSAGLRTLLENPTLRRDLGAQGRAWITSDYSYARFSESFARLRERARVA